LYRFMRVSPIHLVSSPRGGIKKIDPAEIMNFDPV